VVSAPLEAGHAPRLLVRDEAKLARVAAVHGFDPSAVSLVVGEPA
jgi:hypothetical protein